METEKVIASQPTVNMLKMEMDRSYRKSDESGVFSNDNSTSSMDSSWEFLQDEVADPKVFDPPILQSSNLMVKRINYNISSIEGDLASSRVGKNCNSTEIGAENRDGLVFGFLTESKAEPYAHASGWRTARTLLSEFSDDSSSWSLVSQRDIKLFGQPEGFCKNGKIEVSNDLNLKMAVTFGDSLRGSEYDDFAGIRIIEIAKIRSKCMVAEKVRFEFACVLPGITSETPQKEGIFIAEPRLALMTGLFTENIKEIRRLLQILTVLADNHVGQTQIESDCLIASLQAFQCKPGCANCGGNELVSKLELIHDRNHFEYDRKNEAIEILVKIFMMQEPFWMAKKDKLPRLIEYYLMESLREGMSQHLANVTHCNFLDLNKLIAHFQFALGEHNYRDLNFQCKFKEDRRCMKIYNDDKTERPMFYREHMLYLQCTGVFLTSEFLPGSDIKKWDGESVFNNGKGKKKIRFIGREMDPQFISKLIVKSPWFFRGSEAIPADWPMENCNLWPIKTGNRTLFA